MALGRLSVGDPDLAQPQVSRGLGDLRGPRPSGQGGAGQGPLPWEHSDCRHVRVPALWKVGWGGSAVAMRAGPPFQMPRETWVQSLGWEDPLEKGTAPHASILAWRIPWTSPQGRRVRHA